MFYSIVESTYLAMESYYFGRSQPGLASTGSMGLVTFPWATYTNVPEQCGMIRGKNLDGDVNEGSP